MFKKSLKYNVERCSVVKSIGCSARGPGSDSQHPPGDSMLIIPVSGNLTPFSGFRGHQAHAWCTDIHRCRQNSQRAHYTDNSTYISYTENNT